MRRYLKSGLAMLFALLVLFGSIALHTIVQSQHYGRLVNYVGIVRGATQRLIKLELFDRPNDDLILYLDGILAELVTGEGEYGLPRPDDDNYLQNLNRLDSLWLEMKGQIAAHRDGLDNGERLLSLSEQYFDQANDTVFAADEYSAQSTSNLLIVCIVMMLIMLTTWMFILWAYSKNMLRMENTNQKLSELARRDALTGILNLEAFKEDGQALLGASVDGRLAVVYTDFSDFKYINDVFGYAYGDSILKKYAEILSEGLKQGEICCRISADNFILLLTYENKEEIAERQRIADRKITHFMRNSYNRQSVPTCCGICCVEDTVEQLNIDGIIDRANFARKTVKNGKNPNYVYYDESIRSRLMDEKNIEGKMIEALENREFTVYYQPKVELKNETIAAAEALVRWQSQNGEIIPPDRFIPVFERKHMIDRLDQYVMVEVCRFLRGRLDEGKSVFPISVNVSRLQFYDQNFVKRYTEICYSFDLPPNLLEIEFTESIAVDNADLMIEIVNQLRAEGFSCSIDDFGKGYSSLSLLKSLPIDILKIDRFFFAQSSDPNRDLAVVDGIIDLVHKFNIRTVAEGIEMKSQLEHLKKVGCDYVQGYVFHRPMPQDEFEKLLDSAAVCQQTI